MTPASAKAKGRKLQNWVRDRIKDLYGIEADVAIMGERGKDVRHERLPYSIECKNVEKLNLWQAWQQAKDNLFEGDTPVVILTRNRADTLAVVPVEWFLDRLEVGERDNVQPERLRTGPSTTGEFSSEGDGSGPCMEDGSLSGGSSCVACRCLEAAGWVRPSQRENS